jgi:hypothetical protein
VSPLNPLSVAPRWELLRGAAVVAPRCHVVVPLARRGEADFQRGLCLDEGVLSIFSSICCSYGYSPYKQE